MEDNPEDHHLAVPSTTALIYLRVSTARQATKNGEAEGYSIPAQREACRRKAQELGAEVIEEYVDAGASARSADRDGLQQLLKRVRGGGVSYVIVHKLDRLARSRIDDAEIATIFHLAGTTLVSASEQIDDSPSGSLLHGIMAAIAEHYSKNLSHEAKKGMAEKVRRGGTPTYAPIGYLNTIERLEGIEVRTIAVDDERAPHVKWAYEQYAKGAVSISDLRDALEDRGLKSRKTRKLAGKPLSTPQIHRMLRNPYYKGQILFNGVLYDGKHEPLVDEVLWQRVQGVLASRRLAGDRAWQHTHFLKGALRCARCQGRMGYGFSKGKGGTYEYFFCLGRHTGRTECDLPYLSVEDTEDAVARLWTTVTISAEEAIDLKRRAQDHLTRSVESGSRLVAAQKRRVVELERQQHKLLDAYMADALPIPVLRQRQTQVEAELADAHRLIRTAQTNSDEVNERLEQVICLLEHAPGLYAAFEPNERALLNRAAFEALYVDAEQNGIYRRTEVVEWKLDSMIDAVLRSRRTWGEEETLDGLQPVEGSNVIHLAEVARFELARGLNLNPLSRRAH